MSIWRGTFVVEGIRLPVQLNLYFGNSFINGFNNHNGDAEILCTSATDVNETEIGKLADLLSNRSASVSVYEVVMSPPHSDLRNDMVNLNCFLKAVLIENNKLVGTMLILTNVGTTITN